MFLKYGVKVYSVNCLLGIVVGGNSFNLLSNSYIAKNINTVFIVINAPGRCIFQKGGRLLQINKIISRVQWPWAIMDTCCLDLACWHV